MGDAEVAGVLFTHADTRTFVGTRDPLQRGDVIVVLADGEGEHTDLDGAEGTKEGTEMSIEQTCPPTSHSFRSPVCEFLCLDASTQIRQRRLM